MPSSLRPATAEIRPLMVADPMLRAFRPEITPASITGALAAPLIGGASAESCAGCSGAKSARVPGPAGKWKSVSSAGPFASTDSMVKRCVLGPPFFPDSMEVGT